MQSFDGGAGGGADETQDEVQIAELRVAPLPSYSCVARWPACFALALRPCRTLTCHMGQVVVVVVSVRPP